MKRIITRLFVCTVIFSVLLTAFCACGTGARRISFRNAVKQSPPASAALHTGDEALLSAASSAASAVLMLDNDTFNIAYADAFSDKLWAALPQEENSLAATVSAVLVSDEGRYYLNTQDNAVAFGTVKKKDTADGIHLTYTMAQTKETAKKSVEDLLPGEAYLRLTLAVCVDDGRMTVEIDCGDLFVPEGFILEKLSVLPYFGAIVNNEEEQQNAATESITPSADLTDVGENGNGVQEEVVVSAVSEEVPEDYLVVPDGSGAMIRTNAPSTAGLNLSFPAHTGDGINSPYVPAAVFGVKNGNNAFVCAVTQGDAVASVRALNLSDDACTLNTAYAEFLITDTLVSGAQIYYGTPYTGKVRLVYKFLSGNAADYISMAIAAGEELIRAGVLPQKQIADSVVPLNVGVICSADGTGKTVATTYAQAEDMLSVLKARGINSANVLLQGAFPDGIMEKTLSPLRGLRVLGGEKELYSLCSFAEKQGFQLFAGVNMLSAKKKDAARGISGEVLSSAVRNPLYPEVGERTYTQYLLRSDKIADGALHMLSAAEKLSLAGVCVNDAAKNVFEDISSGDHRTEVAERIGAQLSSIAAGKKLAMNGADLAAVKNASVITSLPFDAYYVSAFEDAYTAIPLFPAMLHGSAIYSGFAANAQAAPYLYLLKTVEYGGVPYYEWTGSQSSRLYYENSLAEAADFISLMNEKLGDLLSEPIIGHAKLREGVYRTVYENGAVVFVNYNNYSVIINRISVSPYSFLRLN